MYLILGEELTEISVPNANGSEPFEVSKSRAVSCSGASLVVVSPSCFAVPNGYSTEFNK